MSTKVDESTWEKLFEFMDKNSFSVSDFLAVVCAAMERYDGDKFKETLLVAGKEYRIRIEKL